MDRKTHNKRIQQRKKRVRTYIQGTPERPRFSIHKSNTHIALQAIDDVHGVTLAAAQEKKGTNAVKKVADAFAKALTEKKITRGVCDRGQYRYHGIVKEIVEELRTKGIHV